MVHSEKASVVIVIVTMIVIALVILVKLSNQRVWSEQSDHQQPPFAGRQSHAEQREKRRLAMCRVAT